MPLKCSRIEKYIAMNFPLLKVKWRLMLESNEDASVFKHSKVYSRVGLNGISRRAMNAKMLVRYSAKPSVLNLHAPELLVHGKEVENEAHIRKIWKMLGV